MTFEEAIVSTIPYRIAKREILRHCMSWEAFVDEFGVNEFYHGSDIMDWLGYAGR